MIYYCLTGALFLVSYNLLAQSPRPASPTSLTYGKLQFSAPAGWQTQQKADMLILTPPGTTINTTAASITVFPPAARNKKSLSQWMDLALSLIRSDYQVLRSQKPTPNTATNGTKSLIMTELLGEPSGSGKIYQLYCAVATGSSAQLVMYSASNPIDFNRHAKIVNSVIESISVKKTSTVRRDEPPTNRQINDRLLFSRIRA